MVTVLVTTFRHARWVEEALDSLRAQSCRDFETVITDDASDDGTAEVVGRWLERTGWPASFVRNPVNRGVCASRNAALARSTGRFVCTLSGDDAYLPDRIERQAGFLLAAPEIVAAVYSDADKVDVEGRPLARSFLDDALGSEPRPEGAVLERLLRSNFVPAPATMVRRDALAAIGGYDETLAFDDYDLWLRLCSRYELAHLPGRVVRYRVHGESMSQALSWRPVMYENRRRALRSLLGRDEETDRLVRSALRERRLRRAALSGFIGLPGGGPLVDRALRLRVELLRRYGGDEGIRAAGRAGRA